MSWREIFARFRKLPEEQAGALSADVEEMTVEGVAKASAQFPTPEVTEALIKGDVERARHALRSSMKILSVSLEEQAKGAVEDLYEVSEQAADAGRRVLTAITRIGVMVSSGELDVRDGERAVENYMQSLILIGEAARNEAAVAAYKRSRTVLSSISSVVFALLRMGLNVSSTVTAGWINGLRL